MKIKEVFYGQVRAVTETFNGTHNYDTPPPLKIRSQEAVTWNNNTNMNPLLEQCPVPYTELSYGEMIHKALETSSYANKWSKHTKVSVEAIEAAIRKNHRSDYAMLCHTLSQSYGLDRALVRPDILEYDWVIARQFDTWYNNPNHNYWNYVVFDVFNEPLLANDQPFAMVLDQPVSSENYPRPNFPIVGNIASFFIILNKKAVEQLRGRFFRLALQEIDLLHYRFGKFSEFVDGNAGNIFFRVLMKENIHCIDISKHNMCYIKPGWVKDCKDYGRSERNSGEST